MILTSGRLEVARGVVTLRQENVVICTTLEWLVQGDWRAEELLLNLSKTV
jgi:predicted Rdx family selenoprotein